MEDELKDVVIDATESENLEQNKPVKSFTQEQLNEIVKQRLSREEIKLNNLKTDFDAEKKAFEEQIKTYETALNEIITSNIENLSDSYKKLFDKLSVLEKIEWIKENESDLLSVDKKFIAESPKSHKETGKKEGFKPYLKDAFKI